MSPEKLGKWLEDLSGRAVKKEEEGWYDKAQAAQWVAEADSALSSFLPTGHALRRTFTAIVEQPGPSGVTYLNDEQLLDSARGVVRAARDTLANGHLSSILDGVQAETVGELLDQAESLIDLAHIAAAVLAGGVLETHLAHLCVRNKIPIDGSPSIEKYNNAIGEARTKGTATVYGVNDGKEVTSWGGKRNDAAHRPMEFKWKPEDIRLMIAGIRQFLARVP